jgi:hypothetical protein
MMTETLSPRKKAESNLVRKAVRYASDTLEFTDQEVGSALGASARSVARWRSANTTPAPRAVVAAERLLELSQALQEVFGDDVEALQAWLHERVPALGRRTPLRAIVDGDIDDVLTVVANTDGGVFV